MQNTHFMQVPDSFDNLRSPEDDLIFLKTFSLNIKFLELTAIDIWHDKVQILIGFKTIAHFYQKGTIACKKNILF